MNHKTIRILTAVMLIALLLGAFSMTASASGNVAGAVENTWTAAQGQVKQIVNNVVFPVIDLILAVLFFVKVGTSYFDYRKHGQFDFTAPAILFACLLAPITTVPP